jgi:hypothetical protein
MSKVITIWEVDDDDVWEYNHYSDGYDKEQLVPISSN